MSKLTIRNCEDAWHAFNLLCDGSTRKVDLAFENCVITVDASEPIEGMRKARAFIALQVAIRRQFCWLRHGTRHLGRLSTADRAATEIQELCHPNGRHIRYDLTRALNALASAVEQWDDYGPPWLSRTGDFFTATIQRLGSKVETWPQAARDVGVAYIESLAPKDRKGLGQLAVVMCALTFMVPNVLQESLSFVSKRWDAALAHQERIALAEPTIISTAEGRRADLELTEIAKLQKDIGSERTRIAFLMSQNIETPLLRFVVAEAETARPTLLDVAPQWGTITINGTTLSAGTARAGARALRKIAKERRDTATGWITTTVEAKDA